MAILDRLVRFVADYHLADKLEKIQPHAKLPTPEVRGWTLADWQTQETRLRKAFDPYFPAEKEEYGELAKRGVPRNVGSKFNQTAQQFVEQKDNAWVDVGNSEYSRLGKELTSELGDEGIHKANLAYMSPEYATSTEHVNWWNGLPVQTREKVRLFHKSWDDVRKPIMEDLVSMGKLPQEYIDRPYIPQQAMGFYKVYAPDKALWAEKSLTDDQIVNSILRDSQHPIFATHDLREAQKYIVDNNLAGKSLLLGIPDIPADVARQFSQGEIKELMTRLIKGTVYKSTQERERDVVKLSKMLIDEVAKSEEKDVPARLRANTSLMLQSGSAPMTFREMNLRLGELIKERALGKSGFQELYRDLRFNKPEYTGVVNAVPALRELVDNYYHMVTTGGRHIDDFVLRLGRKWGISDQLLRETFSLTRAFQASTKIGLNPLTWLVNASQPFTNVYPVLGFKKFARAYKEFLSPRMRDILNQEGYVFKLGGVSEKSLEGMARDGLLKYPLMPFQWIEIVHNRGLTFTAGYLDALDKGVPEATARLRGHDWARFFNFDYSIADHPAILNSPFWALAGQFKTFTIGQFKLFNYFLKEGIEGNPLPLARFLGMYTALGGTASLPILNYYLQAFPQLSAELEQKAPYLTGGLPTVAGGRITGPLGIELPVPGPQQLAKEPVSLAKSLAPWLAGPTISGLADVMTTLAKEGPVEAIKKGVLEETVPGLRRAQRLGEGTLRTPGGKLVSKVTPGERGLMYFGVTPERVARLRNEQRLRQVITQKYKAKRENYMQKIIRAMIEGDHETAGKLSLQASRDYIDTPAGRAYIRITNQDIQRNYKEYQKPIWKRTQSIPKALRPFVPITAMSPQ